MVFFVCDGCNETLKRNQVDTHAGRCHSCYAVTCVDCNVSFPDNDYKQHMTCISEAEKYQGNLYQAPKKKAGKQNPQEAWMELVVNSANQPAPAGLKSYLQRMADLGNVPRQRKKFGNFVKNSLALRSDAVVAQLWDHLDGLREAAKQREQEGAAAAAAAQKEEDEEEKENKEPEEEMRKKKKKKKKGSAERDSGEEEGSSKKRIKTEGASGVPESAFKYINQENKGIKWKKAIKDILISDEAKNQKMKRSKLFKKVKQLLGEQTVVEISKEKFEKKVSKLETDGVLKFTRTKDNSQEYVELS
uniref:Zinc finger C2H2 LYAR-type domain-containing protein n=1 Tax=Heterosigma akashiwo TaxID=2829 RepID=A0A7S4DDA0_HETAK